MRQILSTLLFALALLFSGVALAVDEAVPPAAIERYEALLAGGMTEIEAFQTALQEFGDDAEQVSELVTRASNDTGDPGAVAAVAVRELTCPGNTDSVSAAVDAALAQTTSTEQATRVAALALNAVSCAGGAADAARQSIIDSALANNVDPGSLLDATAAIEDRGGDSGGAGQGGGRGGGPPAGGDFGTTGAPGSGGGGGASLG